MSNYKDVASELAKEKANINQVYTCVDEVKKTFRFKNLKDFEEIKKINKQLEELSSKIDKVNIAIEKLAKIILEEVN